MITVGMYYDVIKGKEEEFEEKFEAVTTALDGSLGHVQSLLYRQVKKPNSYTILSKWDSQDAFKEFIQSDAFKRVTDWGKAEILEGRPRHKIYGNEGDVN
ncbi:MAG: antibiotic biosynthesis monooxygenase [Nitrospinota bacterium]|jgi:heme-degrading monooxygenase HmoA|nr:antibiotic biosynthesis monooxygenase [Nitrospinota bacterium]MDP7166906.1 antibiotic biosynthesis monooxygenase [Nitrospinota bacterium]MDP7370290.1 antibiotic biosynthesis monooxygenase [Nitrospinota bacterium]MDP7502986.1 antibiotic biosynthesis monooxygenase [Nitrospinota bacterium]MDP7662364.1 antibiotic biosynthesis monooxygenase [Nitrospinota bacterium]